MKRLIIFLLILFFAFPAIASDVPVFLNEKPIKFDVSPHLADGRVSVPIREISEALGADVSWDDASKTAYIALGNTEVAFKIGEKYMMLNGKSVPIDANASIINSRTFVPVRALCEALGLDVWWKDSEKSVYLSEIPDFGNGYLISPTYYVASSAPEGCVLACKTMVLSNHFDKTIEFNDMLTLNNNTVYTYWGPQYSLDAYWHIILSADKEISPARKLKLIISEIEGSSGIIAQFSNGIKQHGVVITGYTPEGELIVCDPDTKSDNPANTPVSQACLADMFGCYTTRDILPYLCAMRRIEK